MRRAVVAAAAFVLALFVCRAPTATPTTKPTSARSARIDLPRRAIERLESAPREHRVRGVVETADGVLVRGARVVARTTSREDITDTVSDEHGRFELAVDAGSQLIDVEAAGFARAREYVDVTGTHELRFRLLAGTAVRGRVVRENGAPCASPRVMILVEYATDKTLVFWVDGDAGGAFHAEHLPAGDASIHASGPGCITERATQAILEIGRTEEVEVRAVRGFSIHGVVVASDTGEPFAGVTVEGRWQLRPHDRVTTTDAAGRFSLHGFGADEIGVEARLPGYLGSAVKVAIVERDAHVRIELGRGRTIRGRVEPPLAAHVEVDIATANPRVMRQVMGARVETDASGVFTLANLPDGALAIVAEASGRRGEATVAVTGDQEIVIEMRERAPVSVAFEVVERTGQPVAHTRVWLDDRDRSAVTGANGVVTFAGIAGGSAQLRVDGRLAPDGTAEHPVDLDDGARRLVVVQPKQLAKLRGRVFGVDGQLAAQVHVSAGGASTLTHNDGSFELPLAVPLPMQVDVASHDGRQVASIEASRPDVTIRLEERFHVQLRVTQDGVPVDRYDLGCRTKDGWLYGMSRHAGRLRGLAAGPLECQVMTASGAGHGKIAVGRGAPNVLAIELVKTATITGRAPGAPLVHVHAPRGFDTHAEPDASGRFTIGGLPPGPTAVGAGGEKRTITTTSGTTVDVGEIRVP